MKRTVQINRMLVASVVTPLLIASTACGPRDNAGGTDSAGGTMAMADSGGMGTMGGGANATGAMDAPVAQTLATVNRSEVSMGQMASTKARNADVKAYAQRMVDEHTQAMQTLTTMASSAGWSIDSAAIMAGSTGAGGAGAGRSSAAGTAGSGTPASGAGTGAAGGGTTGAGASTGAAGGGTSASGNASGTGSGTGSGSPASLMSVLGQMQQMNASSMQQMRGQSGAAFDRSYMDAQVAAHQQVLDILRQNGNSLQNNELRTHVTQLQGSIEQHLQEAKDIRQRLGGTTGGNR